MKNKGHLYLEALTLTVFFSLLGFLISCWWSFYFSIGEIALGVIIFVVWTNLIINTVFFYKIKLYLKVLTLTALFLFLVFILLPLGFLFWPVYIVYLLIYLGSFFIYSILTFITLLFFSKMVKKKSFEQIHHELSSKKTQNGQISAINYIHLYLQKYTFEELLFLNMKYKGIRYFPYCHYFLMILFITISFSIDIIHGVNDHHYHSEIFVALAPTILTFIPIFIFGVINRKARIGKNPLKKCGIRLFANMIEIIFIILLLKINLFIFSYLINLSNPSIIANIWIANLIKSNIINHSTFFSTFSGFKIKSLESNQLCISGFYFSLAVGGTVVLSMFDRYIENENYLRNNLLDQLNILNYEINCKCLSLDFSDLVIFNYKNNRELRIKKKIDFNIDYIKNFESILSYIQMKLKCEEIKNLNIKMDIFKYFISLIIFTYIIGIILMFIPEYFATYFLWFFIIDSILFGILIYNIYNSFTR